MGRLPEIAINYYRLRQIAADSSGKNLPAFLQHLAAFCAKCAFRALQRVAYGIDSAAAFNNAV
jgi:hypothetical protein